MAKDFKASQVRTTQIIASGSTSGKPALMIVSASSPGVDFDGGGINNATTLTGVGRDVFIFVSGSKSSKNSSTVQGVTVFGGDIVVSGTAYDSNGNTFGATAPGGSDTHVQFNDGGNFGGDSGFTFNKNTDTMSVGSFYVTGSTASNWISGSLNVSGNVKIGDASSDSLQVVSNTWFDNSLNVSGSVTVAGNLTIRGTTTAVSSSNLTIADPIIYIASGSITAGTKSAIAFASGSQTTNQSLIFGSSGASNILAAAKQDVQSGSLAQASLSFTDLVPLQASSFLAGGTSAFISSSNGSSLELAASTQVLVLSGGASASVNPRNFTDTNFFVSGSTRSKGTSTRGTAVFGGDVVVSGNLHASAISGSLTKLTDGSSYIVAGNNISVTTSSNGSITIVGTVPQSTGTFNDVNSKLSTTGTFAIAGGRGFNYFADNVGPDVNFFVSGTIGSKNSLIRGTSAFGGDLVITGNLYANESNFFGKSIDIGRQNLTAGSSPVTGSLIVRGGPNVATFFGSGSQTIHLIGTGSAGSGASIIFGDYDTSYGVGIIEDQDDTMLIKAKNRISIQSSLSGIGINKDVPTAGYALHVGGSERVEGSLVLSSTLLDNWLSMDSSAGRFNMTTPSVNETAFSISSVAGGISKDFFSISTDPDSVNIGEVAGASQKGTDIFLYVSGAIGSKGTSNRGTTLFGGDVVLSGSLYGSDNRIFITSSIAALATDRAGLSLRQVSTDANISLSGSLNNPGLFGDSITRPYITTETTNQNIAFVLKGGSNTRVEFIPDDDIKVKAFISGSGYISGTTVQANALSGSLTKLKDGTSYLIAGDNVTITTGSNGAVTIASTGGGGGGSGDANATYLVLSATGSLNNERVITAGTGISAADGGAGGNYTIAISDSVVATVSGTTFTGVVKANAGLSGSLTKLTDGTSYLIAGSNVTITTGSNGAVTIASTASGGGGGGDPAATYVVISATGSLDNERVLTAGTGISINDGGAGGNVTLGINDAVVATVSGTNFTGVVGVGYSPVAITSTGSLVVRGGPANNSFFGAGCQTVHLIGTASNGHGGSIIFGDYAATYGVGIMEDTDDALLIKSKSRTQIKSTTSTIDLNAATQVLVNAEFTSPSPSTYTDTNFYVAGSVGSKNSAISRGTSVFGGDLMISGSTYVASGQSIFPVADRTSDLGSPTKRWGNVYTGDLHLRNDRGDWTIVEEEDYLCVVNNKTGKKFKMALIPLEE